MLNITEPPVRATRLHRCYPATQRIESGNNREPDQVHHAQADAVALWEVTVVSEKLLRSKALRDTEQQRYGVNQIEMRDVERQRSPSKRHQYILDPAVPAFGEGTHDRGRSQGHQQIEQTWWVLCGGEKRHECRPDAVGIEVPLVRVAIEVERTQQSKPEYQANPNPQQPRITESRRALKETGRRVTDEHDANPRKQGVGEIDRERAHLINLARMEHHPQRLWPNMIATPRAKHARDPRYCTAANATMLAPMAQMTCRPT